MNRRNVCPTAPVVEGRLRLKRFLRGELLVGFWLEVYSSGIGTPRQMDPVTSTNGAQ